MPDISDKIDHYLSNTKTKYVAKLETMVLNKNSLTDQSDVEYPAEFDEAYDSNWADEF